MQTTTTEISGTSPSRNSINGKTYYRILNHSHNADKSYFILRNSSLLSITGTRYAFYAGCSNSCESDVGGVMCNYRSSSRITGCTFEQCQKFANGNGSYGFSHAQKEKFCRLCDATDVAKMAGQLYIQYGVYVKSTPGKSSIYIACSQLLN